VPGQDRRGEPIRPMPRKPLPPAREDATESASARANAARPKDPDVERAKTSKVKAKSQR